MKYLLIIAIVISAIIALYEAYFVDTVSSAILAIIALILTFYGYVLLKCRCCCKPTKKKR